MRERCLCKRKYFIRALLLAAFVLVREYISDVLMVLLKRPLLPRGIRVAVEDIGQLFSC